MNDINLLITKYKKIEIPEDLEFVVKQTIFRKEKSMKRNKMMKTIAISVAAVFLLFVGTVNISPTVAEAMSNIPVINQLVQLVTINKLTFKDDHHEVDVQVPRVEGLENKVFEDILNAKYLEKNTKLYQDFMKEIGENELTSQNLALFTNYTVKVETDNFMVVQGITTKIAASGSESVVFDNIDLENQMIISLPSLFIDDSYIDIITENIKAQMRDRMRTEEGVMFFILEDGDIGGFDKIIADQSFYINADSKLVISFNEYEVAPGVMGMVEFVIPTEVIQDLLVSNMYVK